MNTENVWRRLFAKDSEKQFVIGASVFRLIAGFGILVEYLLNYGQRRYFFGPEGLWPWEVFTGGLVGTSDFSIYAWSESIAYFEICYHLGLLVALLWFLGWRTRWMTPLNLVFMWSLHVRYPDLTDGGDMLLKIILIYAMFADVGSYFSLDALRDGRKRSRSPMLERVAVLFHNAAIMAFAIQLALVYFVSGFGKVRGEVWLDGTALYHVLRNGEFIWPGYSELVYENAYLVTLLSYSTVMFQLSFPFLLFLNRRTRVVAVVIGMLFHIGIALFLGLFTFSMFMMAVDLTLVTDEEYRTAKRWLRRNARSLGLSERSALSMPQGAGDGQ